MYIDNKLYNRIRSLIPIICVELVIERDQSLLLVKRNKPPAKDQWWTPGGRILKDESIAMACKRKIEEEVGLDGEFVDIIGITETMFDKCSDCPSVHTVNIVCLMHMSENNQNISLDIDHDAYIWQKYPDPSFHTAVKKIFSLRNTYNESLV